MLLIELFDDLPITIEEMQILESARAVWSKRKSKVIQSKTRNKGSSKSCENIMNISHPQKIVIESLKNGR